MALFSTNELISASEIVKRFGSYLGLLMEKEVDKLAILKNNKVEAVLISTEEYERMTKLIEGSEIINSINKGLNDVKNKKTKPLKDLWNEL